MELLNLDDVKIELLGGRHSQAAERMVLGLCEEVKQLRARVAVLEEQVEAAGYEHLNQMERAEMIEESL